MPPAAAAAPIIVDVTPTEGGGPPSARELSRRVPAIARPHRRVFARVPGSGNFATVPTAVRPRPRA
eukprot:1031863-Prymnesium_polylepis.1